MGERLALPRKRRLGRWFRDKRPVCHGGTPRVAAETAAWPLVPRQETRVPWGNASRCRGNGGLAAGSATRDPCAMGERLALPRRRRLGRWFGDKRPVCHGGTPRVAAETAAWPLVRRQETRLPWGN